MEAGTELVQVAVVSQLDTEQRVLRAFQVGVEVEAETQWERRLFREPEVQLVAILVLEVLDEGYFRQVCADYVSAPTACLCRDNG